MSKLKGIIFIIIAAVFFGMMPIWAKQAYMSGLTTFDVTFMRSGIAAALLGVFICWRKIEIRVTRLQIGPLLTACILGYTGTMLTLFLAYRYVSAGVATSLHYVFPVLVMMFDYFIYHEKLRFYKGIALLISLIGIYLIADPGGSIFSLSGVSLAISSAVFFVIYVLLIGHPQLRQMDSLVLAFYGCLIAAVISLFLLLVQDNWPLVPTVMGLYYTSLISIFCALGQVLFIKGVKIIGPTNASILSTLEPMLSLAAGIIILHESLTWYSTLGCSMIISTVILIGYGDLREKPTFQKRKKVHKCYPP